MESKYKSHSDDDDNYLPQSYRIVGVFNDVTPKDYTHIVYLQNLEKAMRPRLDTMSPDIQAKCLIALAYDYIMMDMEELAERYINESFQICPTYFSEFAPKHEEGDEHYSRVLDKIEEYLQTGFKQGESYATKPKNQTR